MPAARGLKVAILLWAPLIWQSTPAQAQIHATCTNSSFSWSFNSKGQSPCEVGEALGGVCRPTFAIQALPEGFYYSGVGTTSVTDCVCNTVYYTMLSVCGLCQGGSADRFDLWSKNCTTTTRNFPEPIPAGVNVPHYAYLPLDSVNQTVDLARLRADIGLESTGVASRTSTATSGSLRATSTLRSGGGSGQGSGFDDDLEETAKKAGIIAVCVVAGIWIVWAIGAGLIYWICRRQSRRRYGPPEQMYQSGYVGANTTGPDSSNMGTYAAVPPGTPMTPNEKIYNPNDPATFPHAQPALGYQATTQQPYTPDRTSAAMPMPSSPTTPNQYSPYQQQPYPATPDRNSVYTGPMGAAPGLNPYNAAPYQNQQTVSMPVVGYDTGSAGAPNRLSTPPRPHQQAYMSGVPQV
ncbi:hypothetical protein V5O48_002277 [Marasmius crinis-equi]|uniref:Uncharacterized protein n=1 Tax=Marasmius crinis-equi TaxID=585013 RepID=A0ABR3FW12_9AGAR